MKQVLLLRGINVGGHGKLPMADLRDLLTGLGAANVQTYIQSGNAVFDGNLTTDSIAEAIEHVAGFRPSTMLLSHEKFFEILTDNPFTDDAQQDPKSVHVWIGATKLSPLPEVVKALAKNEQTCVKGQACFLHATDGIGRSKLAARLERAFDQPVTARNWRTISAIAAML